MSRNQWSWFLLAVIVLAAIGLIINFFWYLPGR